MTRWFPIIAVIWMAGYACTSAPSRVLQAYDMQGIKAWRTHRLAELRKPDGWPTLVGLYWLKKGKNTVGSGKENDIQLPASMPLKVGTFRVENDSVTYLFETGTKVSLDGQPVSRGRFRTDLEQHTTYLFWKSYQWHIIDRGGKFGMRLRDTLHPARLQLTGIPAYPVRPKWIKEAIFTRSGGDQTISMKNQVGMTIDYRVEGYLAFKHQGREYRLTALDGGPENLFVLISDQTTGVETYGGGRYMDVPRPKSAGLRTYIDFNRAYNPPCVFTDFATCLLPPQENELPFPVKAGEKDPGHH